jgi:hypothetical protein
MDRTIAMATRTTSSRRRTLQRSITGCAFSVGGMVGEVAAERRGLGLQRGDLRVQVCNQRQERLVAVH